MPIFITTLNMNCHNAFQRSYTNFNTTTYMGIMILANLVSIKYLLKIFNRYKVLFHCTSILYFIANYWAETFINLKKFYILQILNLCQSLMIKYFLIEVFFYN